MTNPIAAAERIAAHLARCVVTDELRADAAALLGMARGSQWRPIETAPKDGTAILGYGVHSGSPPDAQRGVVAGDHWWGIILWDVWRHPAWVFSKDGKATWSDPTHWMPLPEPPEPEPK